VAVQTSGFEVRGWLAEVDPVARFALGQSDEECLAQV
jgi:hypothetical protein